MSWLLLRGLGRERRHWHDFPGLLAAGVAPSQVHLLDLAGAGTEFRRLPWPSVPWLARDVARRLAALSASEAAPWSLIGVSLGGMVALELCRLMSPRIERAVIVNSSSRETAPSARLRLSSARQLGTLLGRRSALDRESAVLALTSRLPEGERRRYAVLGAQLAAQAPMSRLAFSSQLAAAARFAPPPPRAVSARLLFLASRCDTLVNPVCTGDLARLYAAESDEHTWAGHDLALDDPVWLCQRVLRFAAELP
jgi:pimeloyl-ACP methyl ester carboxylesterase